MIGDLLEAEERQMPFLIKSLSTEWKIYIMSGDNISQYLEGAVVYRHLFLLVTKKGYLFHLKIIFKTLKRISSKPKSEVKF